MALMDTLATTDPELKKAIDSELSRQKNKLELIASENIVSRAVMEAQGSVLTNKYAEGYPGKRYYGGCECVDVVEQIAIDRAKKVFGAAYANVQPHSGAQANMAVFFALLTPGDTVMGMNLTDGGHLTHGSPVNMSGTYFKIVPYGVSKETETIDYDALEKQAMETNPKLIVAGASAYARILDFPRLADPKPRFPQQEAGHGGPFLVLLFPPADGAKSFFRRNEPAAGSAGTPFILYPAPLQGQILR